MKKLTHISKHPIKILNKKTNDFLEIYNFLSKPKLIKKFIKNTMTLNFKIKSIKSNNIKKFWNIKKF